MVKVPHELYSLMPFSSYKIYLEIIFLKFVYKLSRKPSKLINKLKIMILRYNLYEGESMRVASTFQTRLQAP